MLKKLTSLTLALVLALTLAACGGSADKGGDAAFSADLSEFYATLYQGDNAPAMMEVDSETAEFLYPGLNEIGTKQSVLYAAAISAVAAEVAMVEVADEADVAAVQEIFQKRIDDQVAGGAWYPATTEAWEKQSEIVTIGNYVCLFVGEGKDDMVSAFRALGDA